MAQAMTHAGIQGKIVQCIGAVVDVEFPRDHMPRVYDALKLEDDATKPLAEKGLTFEVEQQLGDGVVRTIALGSSDGLRRGMKVNNTGAPISVSGTLEYKDDAVWFYNGSDTPISSNPAVGPITFTLNVGLNTFQAVVQNASGGISLELLIDFISQYSGQILYYGP